MPLLLFLMAFGAPVSAGDAPIAVAVDADASGTAVSLAWSRPGSGHTGQVAWEVWRGVGSEALALLVTLPTESSGFIDTDVSPSRSYYYQIRALNGAGGGPWSPLVWERTPDPARPDLFQERFGDGATGWTRSGLWRVSGSCVTVVDAPDHLGYNTGGDRCAFGGTTRSFGEATSAPIDLRHVADATLLFEHHRDVEASARPGHDRMEVRVIDDDGVRVVAMWDAASPGGRAWRSADVDLAAFTDKVVRISFAFDTVDALENEGSGWTVDGIAVRGSPKTAPAEVDDLMATSGPAEGEVSLSWTAPAEGGSPITSYEIRRGTAPDLLHEHDHVAPGSDPAAPLHFTDTGLQPGVVHYYAVRAQNAYGTAKDSNVAYGSAFTSGLEPDPLPYATTRTSAVFDGRFAYVFGGSTAPDDGESHDGVVRFDPATGASETLAVPLPSARHATSAVWVPGENASKAYIFFGEAHQTNETASDGFGTSGCHPSCIEGMQIVEFDPVSMQMSVIPIDDPDLTGRHSTSAAYVPLETDPEGGVREGTGMAWIIGGAATGEEDSPTLSGCHPSCLEGFQIIGFDVVEHDTVVVSFSDPDILPRHGTSAVYVPVAYEAGEQVPGTGIVYAFGGAGHDHGEMSLSGCHPSCAIDQQIFGFDPVTQSSLVFPTTLPVGVSYSSAVFDGRFVYLFGGMTESGPTDVVQRYDPRTGTAEVVGRLDSGQAGTSAVWSPFGSYVFGGDDGTRSTDSVRHFDPRAPQETEAFAGPGAGELTVRWSPPLEDVQDVAGYRIYAGTGGASESRVADVAANVTAFVLSTHPETEAPLGENATWTFKVSALTATSEGPQGERVSATTFDRPGAPRDLTANNDLVDDAIVLEWRPPASDGGAPLLGYLLERETSPVAGQVVLDVGLVTTYTDHECPTGMICTYRVAAFNLVGPGDYSDPAASGLGTPP